jgi:hypothetical protein
MKSSILFLIILAIFICCCQQKKTLSQANEGSKSIIIDSAFRDTVKRHIRLISGRYFSSFNTPIEVRFFDDSLQTDSIIQSDFHMMSWYSLNKDTLDLVAHVGELESVALLIRVIKGQPSVLFFRAPHDVEGSLNFKVSKTDTFTHKVEVTPVRYELILSEVPDTTDKPVIFGHIDMESGDYYDKRDSVELTHRVQMKFFFRSQYRKLDY